MTTKPCTFTVKL